MANAGRIILYHLGEKTKGQASIIIYSIYNLLYWSHKIFCE